MDMERDLTYYNGLEYNLVLKKKGNGFLLSIPELCLVEEDTSIDAAYQRIEGRRRETIGKMIEAGRQSDIIEPSGTVLTRRISTELKGFIIRLLIVAIMAAPIGLVVVYEIKSTVRKGIENLVSEYKDKIVDNK